MKKKKIIIPIIFLALIAIVCAFAFSQQDGKAKLVLPEGGLAVHYIDVGQGDSILIQCGGENILIDAGPGSAEDDFCDYIDALGIKKFEYMFFTHPHEDHIGNADIAVQKYEPKNIILPDAVATTKAYDNMISSIEQSDAKVLKAECGNTYSAGEATLTLLAPIGNSYDDLNNFSIVIRLDYGETSFMFAGDAESKSEKEMLEKYQTETLDIDVLKVGHHGSDTSSTKKFIQATSPSVAVISCGEDNSYNHPNAKIVERYINYGVTLYRTDLNGSVLVCSDGKDITVQTEK